MKHYAHSTIHKSYMVQRIKEMTARGEQQQHFIYENGPLSNAAALLYLETTNQKAWGCPEPNPDDTCPGHERKKSDESPMAVEEDSPIWGR